MPLLSDEQRALCEKFMYNNYVCALKKSDQQLGREEILRVEKMTRGQSDNALWNLLRLDRLTASGCATNRLLPPTRAMIFGIDNEKLVKKNKKLIRLIRECVEKKLGCKVIETVLDCGMFFTKLGLNAASPDAYMLLENGTFVPIEIKCPVSYENVTVDEMRNALNVRKNRYRVKHTAFSVNKSGPAVFLVEHSDPHYRQMQRQMYVLDAPVCAYVVKFNNSFVVNVVNRDEAFCAREKTAERKLFELFVARNNNISKLASLSARIKSFENQIHGLGGEDVKRLARAGFFYYFGKLRCFFCRNEFAASTATDEIVTLHETCENSRCLLRFTKTDAKHPEFYDHGKRLETLRAAGRDVNLNLAEAGVFLCNDTKRFLTFCCDQVVAIDGDIDQLALYHQPLCVYYKLLVKVSN
ncbi:Alk-exo protein [Gynaephora ruoergensis nucleopolyhedrovirus]|nr:Alk-exo protein [Gynaephora ruoergensis nucleopolyhedrovirus]